MIYAGFFMNLIMVAVSLDRSPCLLLLWLFPFAFILRLLWMVFTNRESVFDAFKMNQWVGLLVAWVFAVMSVF